jgi:HEAT repeat protein
VSLGGILAAILVVLPCGRARAAGGIHVGGGAMEPAGPSLSADMIGDDVPADVRIHIERLYSADLEKALVAITALHDMGPKAAPAAPFLASMLEGHFGSVLPNMAGRALLRIGPAAVESVGMALSSTGYEARRRAAYILGVLRDERAIEPLIDAFITGTAATATLGAMRNIGEPAKKRVFEAMKSEDAAVRLGAVRAIPAFSTMDIGHRMLANDGGGGIPVPAGWRSQPVVDALAAALRDENATVRATALRSLVTVANACEDAKVPMDEPLRAAMADPDPEVRLAFLQLISRIEVDDRVTAIAGLLGDDDERVRSDALLRLAETGASNAFDRIAGEARSARSDVRAGAAAMLGTSAEPRFAPLLLELLNDNSDAVRAAAADALGRLRAAESEAALLKALGDKFERVRLAAMLALARCGAKPAADALIPLTKSDDPAVADQSTFALSERCQDRARGHWDVPRRGGRNRRQSLSDPRLGLLPLPDRAQDRFPYADAIEALARVLEGPKSGLHPMAADALIRSSPIGPPSDRVLLAALASDDGWAHKLTIEHLDRRSGPPNPVFLKSLQRLAVSGNMGVLVMLHKMGDTRTVLDRCAGMMKAEDSKVGTIAVGILDSIGDAGLDMLMKHLGDPRGDVRGYVAETLASRMSNPRVDAFVRSAAQSADPHLRAGALKIVGSIRNKELDPQLLAAAVAPVTVDIRDNSRRELVALGKRATPAVVASLKDPRREKRAAAATLLGDLGDLSAAGALAAALRDESPSVRAHAAVALGRLGAKQTLPELVKSLDDPAPGVPDAAASALAALDDASAVTPLIAALDAVSWEARRAAAAALGRLGSPRAANSLARALRGDPDWRVRRAAADALARNGNEPAIASLIAALRDDHWFVRRAAHLSLAAIAGRETEATPEAWEKWLQERQLQEKR